MPNTNRRDFIKTASLGSIGLSAISAYPSEKNFEQAKKQSFKYTKNSYPNYDLETFCYTRAGSFLTLLKTDNKIRVKTIDHNVISHKWQKNWSHDLFDIYFSENEEDPLEVKIKAFPWCVEINHAKGTATITFIADNSLLVHANKATIVIKPLQKFGWQFNDKNWVNNALLGSAKQIMQVRNLGNTSMKVKEKKEDTDLSGSQVIEGQYVASGNPVSMLAIRIIDYQQHWTEKIPDLEKAVQIQQKEVEQWISKMPEVSETYMNAAKMGWVFIWQCISGPTGQLKRQVTLSSKNTWLTKIWAWDNCFEAMALAEASPELAWNILLLFFDHQAPTGQIPGVISNNRVTFAYLKPPVYGWTVLELIKKTGKRKSMFYLEKLYPKIARFTEWWYEYRDNNKNGMPEYIHGNDSGWDNASTFDQGFPTEGSDLAAHLIMNLEGLEKMALLTGHNKEAEKWNQQKVSQLAKLLENVKENTIFSPLAGKNNATKNESLLDYTTLMLGKKLPADIFDNMKKEVLPGGKLYTKYGLASESPESDKFIEDGYWRGAIWAPPNYQIFIGLLDAGFHEEAKQLAINFCNMCNADQGFYENYSALTGKGLRGPAVIWTASVFLLFANWLQKNN